MVDKCVCCGAAIPEGRQVCPSCEREREISVPQNDLISRTEAAARLERQAKLRKGHISGIALAFAAKIVRGVPSAKTAAKEVVLCGMCKEWLELEETVGAGYCNHPCWKIADAEPPIVQFADFCSYGERKDNDL